MSIRKTYLSTANAGGVWCDTTDGAGRRQLHDVLNEMSLEIDAGAGGPVSYEDLTDVPATFAPSGHAHPTGQITGLDAALAGKAASAHSHAQSDITNLVSDLAAKADSAATTAALAGKAAASHTHATVDITGLDAALAGKAAISHSHAYVDITGKPSTFAPSAHTHPQSEVTNLTGDLSAKAPLASPALTGTPTAPTAAGGTNTTQIATTAFVASAVSGLGGGEPHTHPQSEIINLTTDLAAKAPLASPSFTGTPAAPTAAAGTSTTQLATTAFVAGATAPFVSPGLRTKGYSYYTDLMIGSIPDVGLVTSGTAAGVSAGTATVNNPGVSGISTGTTATGRCTLLTGSQSVLFGGGSWTFECLATFGTAVPSSTDNFFVRIGFFDDTTGATPVDGAYFYYDFTTSQWVARTVSNSTQTSTNCGNAATALTFQQLKIAVDATAASVVFSINGAVVATHTTNIPSGAGRHTGWGATINKSVGTNARTLWFDWLTVDYVPSSPLSR